MSAPVPDVREAVREAIKAARMVPYSDGTGGWLFRGATDDELTDAVLAVPAIAAALGERRAGEGDLRARLAEAWDEGAHAGRTYQMRLNEWALPGYVGTGPEHIPNPHHPPVDGSDQ